MGFFNKLLGEKTKNVGSKETKHITLKSLPDVEKIREIQIKMAYKSENYPAINSNDFKAIMKTAKPIKASDPSIISWNYSPWCSGQFNAQSGKFLFKLFLGGRGALTTPDNKFGYFSFEFSNAGQKAGK